MFLVYLMNTLTVLLIAIGTFIILLSFFECCKPNAKSKWCLWMNKIMRVCVEYITFNVFLRWFHEFCLTLFISCLFNLRVDPNTGSGWPFYVSWILCIFFLIAVFLYLVWIVYYFRRSRWPATLDLPVTAIKKWPDTASDFSHLGETVDHFGKKSNVDKSGLSSTGMYTDDVAT